MGLPTSFARASLSDLTLSIVSRGRLVAISTSSASIRPSVAVCMLSISTRPRATRTRSILSRRTAASVSVSFSYQAQSWTKPRRVVAKVEWHPGELYPRVGFIVTNLARSAERVVAFYNQRGTCEQYIKEGKNAIKWTRLSCRTFAANAVRLQLHALAYNLANFMRTLAMPKTVAAMVADQPAREADQDRRQGRQPRPLRHLPDGRGRGAERTVRANPAADRRTATSTGSRVGLNGADASSPREECV